MEHSLARRRFLALSAALGGTALLPRIALAKGMVTGAIYPGAWEEAYRSIVAPALKKAHSIDLEMQPLFAVEQIAKAKAARGAPLFDTFLLDPGPRATGLADGLFDRFDSGKLSNAGTLQPGMADEHGVPVAAQFVGIAYNPKKFDRPPTKWTDLFEEPYVSRLGMTGFSDDIRDGGHHRDREGPGGIGNQCRALLRGVEESLAESGGNRCAGLHAGMFQQGQCDIMYANTQTVGTLRALGVDIAFAAPASGISTFFTTMHLAKGTSDPDNAYKYIDTALSKDVQEQLMKAPYFMAPVNADVVLDDSLPIKHLSEMSSMIQHDWSKINPLRAGWIERFNKEVA